MTTDRDDEAMRRYREASAALDERPSAATRAAVLAAAARHVEAKPRAADAPRAAHRPRWPLAAAAAVLLSTLAVMMAQRTEQEMPTFTAPTERSPEQVAAAPAESGPVPAEGAGERQVAAPALPAAPPASAPPVSARNEVRATPPVGAVEPGSQRGQSAPVGDEPLAASSPMSESRDAAPAIADNAAESRAQAAPGREAASTEARRALPPAPAAPPPPVVAKPAPAEAGAASGASGPVKAEPSPAYRAARKEAAPAYAPAAAAQDAGRDETLRDFEESAKDWLDRIVKLRGEGRHADADAELRRFRERYPAVQVPAAAMPPAVPAAGTR